VAVLDRAISFGAHGGPLFIEICSALYNAGVRVPVTSFIYGLGGRPAEIESIEEVYGHLQKVASTGKIDRLVNFLNLRE
jgi:pyruvate ferredoxin oxidoreductase alpha subunit